MTYSIILVYVCVFRILLVMSLLFFYCCGVGEDYLRYLCCVCVCVCVVCGVWCVSVVVWMCGCVCVACVLCACVCSCCDWSVWFFIGRGLVWSWIFMITFFCFHFFYISTNYHSNILKFLTNIPTLISLNTFSS